MKATSPGFTPPWLRRFTKLVAASTLFLIFAGAMVTSTGSGLAVPDWPNTYGWFMFSFPLKHWVGGIFYEHGHRVIASIVGMLTIVQAIWLQRRSPLRKVRVLGWVSLATVIAQGILGGVTVLLLLPKAISIAHAGLAEIFFCINVAIAFFSSRFYESLARVERGDAPVGATTALFGLVYLQILAGALMRHLGAGLAIPDFPLSFGRVVPEFASTAIIVNYTHRVGAVLVLIAVAAVFVQLLRFEGNHPLRGFVQILSAVVLGQIVLGGYTVWTGKQPIVTSLHVMTGAATLATALMLMLTARAVSWKKERSSVVMREVAA